MMMTYVKYICSFIICIILVGCSTIEKRPTQTEIANINEQKTIHFMHLWSEELYTSKFNVINDIVTEYMDMHPNIKVKVEILDNEQYKDKLKILSTSNSLPDVGVTWPAGYLQPFVEGQLFSPLDSILSEELNETFIKGTTDAFQINDQTYGLPLEFNISPIFYNKVIFEKYNLTIPKTYSQFLTVVKVLRENGVIPIALGNKDRWTGSLWYLYLADRFAGPEILNGALTGAESFNNDKLLKAANEVQYLVEQEAFNKNFNGILNDEAKLHFYEGRAAMYLMGTWELGNFTSNPDISQAFKDKIGFFKFPYVPNENGNMNSWVGGPGVGLFVAENSEVKDEAKQFVAYFVKEWGKRSVEQAGVIPATKFDTSNTNVPKLYEEILGEIKQANSMILYADVLLNPEDAEQHLNQIQALFGLAVTPEQFNDVHHSYLYNEKKARIE